MITYGCPVYATVKKQRPQLPYKYCSLMIQYTYYIMENENLPFLSLTHRDSTLLPISSLNLPKKNLFSWPE